MYSLSLPPFLPSLSLCYPTQRSFMALGVIFPYVFCGRQNPYRHSVIQCSVIRCLRLPMYGEVFALSSPCSLLEYDNDGDQADRESE